MLSINMNELCMTKYNRPTSPRKTNIVPGPKERRSGFQKNKKVNTPGEKSEVTLAASVWLSSRGQQAGTNRKLLSLHSLP